MDVIHEINILINVIHVTYERQSLQHSSSPNFNNHLLYSLGLPPPISTHRQYPIRDKNVVVIRMLTKRRHVKLEKAMTHCGFLLEKYLAIITLHRHPHFLVFGIGMNAKLET